MQHYIKSRAADWILCTCLAASMTAAVCSGFVLEDALSHSPVAAFLIAAVLQALMLVIAYRRLNVRIGIAAGVVLAAVVVVYMQTQHPLADETANSLFIFLLIEVLAAVLTFLLSRTRLGLAVLFLGGNIVQAGAHFLQFPAPLWSFLVFLVAVFAMFFYRVYTVSLLRAEMGKVRIGQYLRQVAAICLAAVLLSGVAYFGVVRPLDPPTQELRLINVLKSMDVLEVLGVSNTQIILDPELTSEQPPEDTEQSDEQDQEESDALDAPLDTDDSQEDVKTTLQELMAIRYDWSVQQLWWLFVLLAALVVGIFVLRVALKRRWRKGLQALPHEDAVLRYYRFFLSRMEKAGLKKPPAWTLREYTDNMQLQLQAFEAGGSTFGGLTAVYEKVLYGGCSVTEEEYQGFETFCDHFYRNLRREIGPVKYYLQIFRF